MSDRQPDPWDAVMTYDVLAPCGVEVFPYDVLTDSNLGDYALVREVNAARTEVERRHAEELAVIRQERQDAEEALTDWQNSYDTLRVQLAEQNELISVLKEDYLKGRNAEMVVLEQLAAVQALVTRLRPCSLAPDKCGKCCRCLFEAVLISEQQTEVERDALQAEPRKAVHVFEQSTSIFVAKRKEVTE